MAQNERARHTGEDAALEERLAALREAADELALDIEERNDLIEASSKKRPAASSSTGRGRGKPTNGRSRCSIACAAISTRSTVTKHFRENRRVARRGRHDSRYPKK
jgi:hypothetical protein